MNWIQIFVDEKQVANQVSLAFLANRKYFVVDQADQMLVQAMMLWKLINWSISCINLLSTTLYINTRAHYSRLSSFSLPQIIQLQISYSRLAGKKTTYFGITPLDNF